MVIEGRVGNPARVRALNHSRPRDAAAGVGSLDSAAVRGIVIQVRLVRHLDVNDSVIPGIWFLRNLY